MSTLPFEAAQAMFAQLSSVYPMSPELMFDLSRLADFTTVKKMDFLLEPGQICKRLYYVHQGLLRFYYIVTDEETGKTREVCTQFMREKDTCVSVESYYLQAPSNEYVQAIEYTEVFSIAFEDLEAMYRKHMDFNYIGRVLTTKYLIEWVRQINSIQKLKVADRYEIFRNRETDLLQRVPQKYIASYLDTTPETISRIRGGGH